jgi:DNA-binding MarR family transcriptional regulator
MQANAETYEPDLDVPDLDVDVNHYRGILKQRTRYYLAQRDAGVPVIGAAILDLIILGNLEGCFMDMESLSEVMSIARPTVRQEVVTLIRDGWVKVEQSQAGSSLHVTEKAAAFAEQLIGIASAVVSGRPERGEAGPGPGISSINHV